MSQRRLVRVLGGSGVAALAFLVAGGGAQAVPPGPPPFQPAPGEACTPSPAWVSVGATERWLTSAPGSCIRQAPNGGWGEVSAGGSGPVSPATPRLVLRVGQTVTFHFTAAPQSVVVLRTLASPRATTGRAYRLSPTNPTWRVRRGSGVLDIQTTQISAVPDGYPFPPRVAVVSFSAVYRAVGGARAAHEEE